MKTYRIEITKDEQLRYISHLDYANLLQRAIRRAGLPAAYSEGFHSHMKVSFASALAVGVTADKEYADVELTKDICQPEFFDELKSALPAGCRLLRVKEIKEAHYKSMNALANAAVYEITLPQTANKAALQKAVQKFNKLTDFIFIREKPGKGAKKKQIIKKEINLKEFLLTSLSYDEEKNILAMTIKVTPSGSIKPVEIILALKQNVPQLNENDILITRKDILADGKNLLDII